MGKNGKLIGKGKAAGESKPKTVGEVNSEQVQRVLFHQLGSAAVAGALPKIADAIGAEALEYESLRVQGTLFVLGNSIAMLGKQKGSDKIQKFGEGMIMDAMHGTLRCTGLDTVEKVEAWVEKSLKDDGVTAEELANTAVFSEAHGDVPNMEAPAEEPTPQTPDEPEFIEYAIKRTDKTKGKNTRVFDPFDGEDGEDRTKVAEGMLAALKTGLPGIPKISKDAPVRCMAAGCDSELTSASMLHVCEDMIGDAAILVCDKHKKLIEEQNQAYVGHMDVKVGVSPEEIEKIKSKYAELRAREANSLDTVVEMSSEVKRFTDDVEALRKKAKDAAKRLYKDALDSEAQKDLDTVKSEIEKLHGELEAARDLHTQSQKEHVVIAKEVAAFSEAHGDIVNGMTFEVGTLEHGDVLTAEAKKDKYPHLGPKDKCECGKTSKQYKNCCGRNVFYNSKTGKPSRSNKGTLVRKSELKG